MVSAKKKLFDQLAAIRRLCPEALHELEIRLVFQRLPEGTHLLRAGETEERIYYIARGLVRGYCHEDEKEITTWLAEEGYYVFSSSGFLLNKPSNESIEIHYIFAHAKTAQVRGCDSIPVRFCVVRWFTIKPV